MERFIYGRDSFNTRMRIPYTRITIVNLKKPITREINISLKWLGTSLGLFNLRDKDKSCFRIFIELLKCAKRKEELTSDELARKLKLSRGTIIHHIKKLMDAGIVTRERNKYSLRANNLTSLIEEIEKDLRRTCDDLKDIAREIDKRLELI